MLEAAFASTFIVIVVNQLQNLAIPEVGNIQRVVDNLNSLIVTSEIVKRKLGQLCGKELTRTIWGPWVRKLTNLLYEVEDINDDIYLYAMSRDSQMVRQNVDVLDQECSSSYLYNLFTRVFGGIRRQNYNVLRPHMEHHVQHRVSSLKKLRLPRRISSLLFKLKKIEEDLDSLLQFTTYSRSCEASSSNANPSRLNGIRLSDLTSLHQANVELTRGREHEKTFIIERFLLDDSSKGTSVSIFGMGGSGKSTLARAIQTDDRIKNQFDQVIWVSVQGNFNPNVILNIEELAVRDGNSLNADGGFNFRINGFLQDRQGGGGTVVNGSINRPSYHRKNLLILDDVWNVHHDAWENLKSFIGSEVTLLITTRDLRVAKITNTQCYHIKKLSDQECSELIASGLPNNLSEGYEHSISCLAKNCCGLPLVAKELGLAIRSKCMSSTDECLDATISLFEESKDLWDLEVFRDIIFPSLKFNHLSLPPESSKCLAYLTLFPQGHPLRKDELSQLWMSEGFIQPEAWTTQGLMKASDYFDELYWNSMLQLSNSAQQEEVGSYQIHEFAHGIAAAMAFNLCYRLEEGEQQLPNNYIHHLSICRQIIEPKYWEVIELYYKRLRTLVLVHKRGAEPNQVPVSVFSNLRYLRVVNLSNSPITSLPGSICNLKHLRYLDAAATYIEKLPDSICELLGLRILKLKKCIHLRCLPKSICKLVNLIFLDVDFISLHSKPPHIGSLTKLRVLDVFIVNLETGKRITELQKMNTLRGSIKIMKLENVRDGIEAEEAKLNQKPHLKVLDLRWTESYMPIPSTAESILTGLLQPNGNLKELRLINYNGVAFPAWLSSPSCNLTKIRLFYCPSVTNLPGFWQLPLLNSLYIDTIDDMQIVDRTFMGDANSPRFVRLERLEFRNMEKLSTWEELVPGDFPRLRDLKIVNCPVLSMLPTFQLITSLVNKEIIGSLSLL